MNENIVFPGLNQSKPEFLFVRLSSQDGFPFKRTGKESLVTPTNTYLVQSGLNVRF